ncbi:MAG: response regulator [Candidatus Nomurabacteria bacterium]|nr:MAG: response regulator [Candidatus Nomurabacteria bacterium]
MVQKIDKVILVVEDERPLASAIQKKLESRDFSVVCARTSEQALHYIEEIDRIDVIWLDHYLLGSDNGLHFLAKIKAEDSRWKNIPVFVVSNTASADAQKAYLQLGIQNYFTKTDHRLDAIVDAIERSLDLKE